MSAKTLFGWDDTNKLWVPVLVDASGNLKVDMSAINLDDLGDVSVASPTDQYLLYWDAATSLWKCRALVDADIPATICRDSELATHAALPDVHHASHVKTLADHPLDIIPTMDDAHIPAAICRDSELATHAALPDVHHASHVKTLADHPLDIIPTMDDAHIPAAIARDTEVATAVSDHAALATGVHGVGAGIVGIQNADKIITDADGDTKIQVEESADEDKIRFDVGGTERIVINSEGNVGIGTPNPLAVLHTVSPSGDLVPIYERDTTSTTARVFAVRFKSVTTGDMADGFGAGLVMAIQDDSGVSNDIAQVAGRRDGADNAGALTFVTYDGVTAYERMRVDKNGNVGIGTNAPTSKLHVVGLPVYANNAAAIAGGLTAGAFYRTGADPDPVCVVH